MNSATSGYWKAVIKGLFASDEAWLRFKVKRQPVRRIAVFLAFFLSLGSQAQTYSVIKSFGVTKNVTGWNPKAALIQGADDTLYGTTSSGQGTLAGTVFKVAINGTGFTTLKWFTNVLEGAAPQCKLCLQNNTLIGTAFSGGTSNCGTVFLVNVDGTDFKVIKSFQGGDGKNPSAGIILAEGTIYGTTSSGGTSNFGTIFKLGLNGTGYTVLKNFTGADGRRPLSSLTLSGGFLYGTTSIGGNQNYGTIFKLATNGSGYNLLHSFAENDGRESRSPLIVHNDKLFGLTRFGADSGGVLGIGSGVIFSLNTDGSDYNVLHQFSSTDGAYPDTELSLFENSLYGITSLGGSSNTGTAFSLTTDGADFEVLWNFTKSPYGGLIVSGPKLYGVTSSGGSSDKGSVFVFDINDTSYSTLVNMVGSDGGLPNGALVLSEGRIYGTTPNGGRYEKGTLFTLDTNGCDYAILKEFSASDGESPGRGLLKSGNVLYGTMTAGSIGNGTIFKIDKDGANYVLLKTFGTEGRNPAAGLVLSDGTLYGTTSAGAIQVTAGTVFKLSTNGSNFTVLKTFNMTVGAYPNGVVVSGTTIYGTTQGGAAQNYGTVFKLNTDGTGFIVLRTNTSDSLSSPFLLLGNTLYGTSSGGRGVAKINTNGTGYQGMVGFPFKLGVVYGDGGLVGVGDRLYGTVDSFGNSNLGAIYTVKTNGTGFVLLKSFAGIEGEIPAARLCLSDSVLYGTTRTGGELGEGVIFRFTPSPQINVTYSGGIVGLFWSSIPGLNYQLQTKTSLDETNWSNIGAVVAATNAITTFPGSIGLNPHQYYRVALQ